MKCRRLVSHLCWWTLSSSRSCLSVTNAMSVTTNQQNFGSCTSTTSGTAMAASTFANDGGEDTAETCQTQNNNNNNNQRNDGALAEISKYHPILIEGMGYYDPRDPAQVAATIVEGIRDHLEQQQQQQQQQQPVKPLLVVTQGDPLAPKGISAITPLVADALSRGERGLIRLDASIDPDHSRNADRRGVILEISYSQLVTQLKDSDHTLLDRLETAVEEHIGVQNEGRARLGKPPVKDYFKTYALLQEVTKAGLAQACGTGSITVAHTSSDINPHSVTSFYRVGLGLGLYDARQIVAYRPLKKGGNTTQNDDEDEEVLDFHRIDPR